MKSLGNYPDGVTDKDIDANFGENEEVKDYAIMTLEREKLILEAEHKKGILSESQKENFILLLELLDEAIEILEREL